MRIIAPAELDKTPNSPRDFIYTLPIRTLNCKLYSGQTANISGTIEIHRKAVVLLSRSLRNKTMSSSSETENRFRAMGPSLCRHRNPLFSLNNPTHEVTAPAGRCGGDVSTLCVCSGSASSDCLLYLQRSLHSDHTSTVKCIMSAYLLILSSI